MYISLILFILISLNTLAHDCEEKITAWSKISGPPPVRINPYLEKNILSSANRILPDSKWIKIYMLEQLQLDLYRSSFYGKKKSLIIYANKIGEVLAYTKTVNGSSKSWCSKI